MYKKIRLELSKMEDPGPYNTIGAIIVILLAVFSFVLTLAASAAENVNEKKLRERSEDGDKKAKRLESLLDKPEKLLRTVSVCTWFAGLFAYVIIFLLCHPLLSAALYGRSIGQNAAAILSALIITLAFSALFVSICLLFPHMAGRQHAEKIAAGMSGYLRFTVVAFTPLVAFVTGIARLLSILLGGDPHYDSTPVTEDEILSMVDEGEEKGVIEESQKEMINNIFEFGDLTAGDVMTHRTYLEAVETTDSLTFVAQKATEEGYSRIPVYEDTLDNIKGIIYVKDLLKYVGTDTPDGMTAESIMREAMFIPESKKCSDLFTEMTEKHLQMVVVADEYGGVAGVVTIEDLIESIVGNIQDEFDDEPEEFEQIAENVFNIDGATDIHEVEGLLDIEFPKGEYDTVAGYVISVLGRIPDAEEHPSIEYAGYEFTVAETDERRIVRLIAEKLPEPECGDEHKDKDKDKDKEKDKQDAKS